MSDPKYKTVWQLVFANRVRNTDKFGRIQKKQGKAREDEKAALTEFRNVTDWGYPCKLVKKQLQELETTDGRKVYLGVDTEDVRANPKWKRLVWNEKSKKLERLIKEYQDKLLQAQDDLEEHRRNRP